MAYVVKRPLNIAGRRRLIGEVLRDDEVLSASVIQSDYISHIPDAEAQEGVSDAGGYISVPIGSGSALRELSVKIEGICEAIRVLQLTNARAAEAVKGIEDIPTLEVIEAVSGAKAVKAAASGRAAELRERAAEGGE